MSTARSAVVAVTVASFLLLLHAGVDRPAGLYDEGNTVYLAWRVAEGQVLYRDLWTIHAPGMPYLLALVFRVLAPSLLVERLLKAALLGMLAALGYACFRRFASPLAAAAGVALGLGANFEPGLISAELALVGVVASLVATLSAVEDGLRPARLVVTGVLIGLTVVVRHDFGLYATVLCTIAVAFAADTATREGVRAVFVGRAVAALWLGVVVPVVVTVAYFAAQGALAEMVRQTLVFPGTTYISVRSLTLPDLARVEAGLPFGVLFWLTPPTLLAGIALSGAELVRRNSHAAFGLLLTSLSGLFLFAYAWRRADLGHLWPSLVLAVPVFAALAERVRRGGRDPGDGSAVGTWRWRLQSVVGIVLVLAVVTLGVVVASALSRTLAAVRPLGPSDTMPPTLRAAGVRIDPTLEQALAFLDARLPAGAPLFVGNGRHDLVFINCSMCYFLLRRPSATRYHNLHPGLVTTAAVQHEIVGQLERQAIGWVLLWHEPAIGGPLEPRQRPGATDLDAYLRSHYVTAARYGDWEIRRRSES